MKKINLNGNKMKDNPHNYIKKELKFPDYYGNNLDALYDCLTDISTDTEIILYNSEFVEKNIIETFIDASKVDEFLSFKIKK